MFWRLHFCIVKYLSFHNFIFIFCLKMLCNLNGKVMVWHTPCFKFAMLLKWRLSISIFSQNWQYLKYESRKSQAPFHILGNSDDFFGDFFLGGFISFSGKKKSLKKQGICHRTFFFQNNLLKNGENLAQQKKTSQGEEEAVICSNLIF